MYKVFAFLKRNARLTHDEYRAGHVGHHCCFSRRLKDIRGYLVNIHTDEPFHRRAGALGRAITFNEPEGFLDLWDGFPEVYFDDRESWVNAATAEPTRATAEGLVIDPDWNLNDGPDLFDAIDGAPGQFRSHHLHMIEHVVMPVARREAQCVKLIQFIRRHPDVDERTYRERVLNEYAPIAAGLHGLNGLIVNFRDPDQEAAMRGFFPDTAWGFSDEGTAQRRRFCALWDAAVEWHFDALDVFLTARQLADTRLQPLERALMDTCWYVEVDENLIVMPNRDPAPEFYFR